MNRQEESPTGGGSGMGAGRAERLPAIEDEGQAAISLTPDSDGTDSGCLLDSIYPLVKTIQ